MWGLNACPLPDRWPAWFSASATPASVWSSSRESIRATVSGGVCQVSQAFGGMGTLHVGSPQPVRLAGPGLDLGLDAERDLKGQGGERVQQEGRDGLVDTGPGDDLAAPRTRLNGIGRAAVLRVLDAAPGVVPNGH